VNENEVSYLKAMERNWKCRKKHMEAFSFWWTI